MSVLSQIAPTGGHVTEEQAAEIVAQACPAKDYRNKKVLIIIPDGTRTAPFDCFSKPSSIKSAKRPRLSTF